MRLRRSDHSGPGIRRRRAGKGFVYLDVDGRRVADAELIARVKDVGYGSGETARADFIVDDSARPSGSAAPLEQRLNRVPGIVSASFNLATMQVRVEYVPLATDIRTIGREIEGFGYRVREM